MPPDERASLRERLAGSADPADRWLRGHGREIRIDRLAASSMCGDRPDAFEGRSVLLATADHLDTACALVDLDGVAGRIVLCPTDLGPEQFAALCALADIDLVVTDRLEEHRSSGLDRPVIRPAWPPVQAAWSGRRDTEWVLATSGTTGRPKLVLHSFGALTDPVTRSGGSGAGSVWATFYDIRRYGGLQMFFRGMLGGGSLVLPGPGEPISDFLVRLAPLGVTHLAGTPSHWRRALMSPALRKLSPRYVRLSGEIADQAVLDALRAAFPEATIRPRLRVDRGRRRLRGR